MPNPHPGESYAPPSGTPDEPANAGRGDGGPKDQRYKIAEILKFDARGEAVRLIVRRQVHPENCQHCRMIDSLKKSVDAPEDKFYNVEPASQAADD